MTINVPYTTMNEFTGVSDYFFSVTMQTDKSLNSQDVADKVVKLMEKRHQCAGKDYFQVQSFQDIMSSMNQMLDMVTAFISFVAGISLLVGGIGVMNIMLVSVTERTSEIGLKKAIGARKKVILYQFLTEASMLTSIGGVIGVILGIVLSKVVSEISGAPTAISIPAIIGSVLFSTLIGVIFGLLPSVKAANLNPIDALRSE